MIRTLVMLAILAGYGALPVLAAGNLAIRAERLEELKLDAVEGFSVKSYRIETGKFYRWRITSDGREEYKLLAPELMRNVWIDQIVIEDKEIKPLGGIHALEFDDEGSIDVYFLVVRPGRYPYFIENLRSQGFEGEFLVE
jgi:hypothetical protein